MLGAPTEGVLPMVQLEPDCTLPGLQKRAADTFAAAMEE